MKRQEEGRQNEPTRGQGEDHEPGGRAARRGYRRKWMFYVFYRGTKKPFNTP
jgi:hypothetical protein